jgi:hypothetical protein
VVVVTRDRLSDAVATHLGMVVAADRFRGPVRHGTGVAHAGRPE